MCLLVFAIRWSVHCFGLLVLGYGSLIVRTSTIGDNNFRPHNPRWSKTTSGGCPSPRNPYFGFMTWALRSAINFFFVCVVPILDGLLCVNQAIIGHHLYFGRCGVVPLEARARSTICLCGNSLPSAPQPRAQSVPRPEAYAHMQQRRSRTIQGRNPCLVFRLH